MNRAGGFVMRVTGTMVLVQPPGAIRAVEVVALARNRKKANCRKKDGE